MFPSESAASATGPAPAAGVLAAGVGAEGLSAAGAALAEIAGSAELAAHLEGWDVTTASAAELVEVVAAYERVVAFARSRAVVAAVELSHRPEVNPEWPECVGRPSAPCTVGTELSLRLGVTRHAATGLVDTGRVLATVLTDTGAMLRAGLLDWPKATAMVEVLGEVPGQIAVEVEAVVLPEASRLTEPQLRRRLAEVIAEIDPAEAQARHALARGRRRVSRPRVLPDGMASMTAVLPAEMAVRLDACLQSAAEVARAGGDDRTPDQLRADALDALAAIAWDTGHIGPCETCVAPGADVAPGLSLRGARARRAQVHVTVGVGTLLGLDERPATLRSYGPIGADVARAIAADGTWRRMLVDEGTGMVVDVGTKQYAPPASMVELVRARNSTCLVPTCAVPARLCETDHTVPFGDAGGGRTSVENLGPLCKTDHLYKTHGGYRLAQPVPGSFVVTTPTGHTYVTGPERVPGVPRPPDPAWLDRLHPIAQVVIARHAEDARRRSAVPSSAFIEGDCRGGDGGRHGDGGDDEHHGDSNERSSTPDLGAGWKGRVDEAGTDRPRWLGGESPASDERWSDDAPPF